MKINGNWEFTKALARGELTLKENDEAEVTELFEATCTADNTWIWEHISI